MTDEQVELTVEIRYDDAARFLIWSNEHRQWWGPAKSGYTPWINEAGRYTLSDAVTICRQATLDGRLHYKVTGGTDRATDPDLV